MATPDRATPFVKQSALCLKGLVPRNHFTAVSVVPEQCLVRNNQVSAKLLGTTNHLRRSPNACNYSGTLLIDVAVKHLIARRRKLDGLPGKSINAVTVVLDSLNSLADKHM